MNLDDVPEMKNKTPELRKHQEDIGKYFPRNKKGSSKTIVFILAAIATIAMALYQFTMWII